MFDRFLQEFFPSEARAEPKQAWLEPRLLAVHGYEDLAALHAGCHFGEGIYRLHDDSSGPRARDRILEAFPDEAMHAYPFGYDWLGRQFAVDYSRLQHEQPLVTMFEPGTGEAMLLPVTFVDFHEKEVIDYQDAALAVDFFMAWSAENPGNLPLESDQCVGYEVPLFLGGKDVVENLEVANIDVYWAIVGQLKVRSAPLSPSTSISGVGNKERG